MSFLRFFNENARWIAGCFLLTFLSTTGQTVFISLSAGDIRAEYGLSNGAWGLVFMVGTLGSAMTLPYLGQMVDRMNPRKVVLIIAPMLALAAGLMAWSTNVGVLIIAIYLLRLFGQSMFPHVAYTATARWFSAQRGRALSLVVLGHNAGDALYTNAFVALALWIGWRNGWLVAAAVVLVVALPFVSTLVAVDRSPRSSDPAPRTSDARDWTRAEVLRDPMFYLAMTGIMAPGFIVTVSIFHQVHLVELRGWSLEVFASAFVVWAASNSVVTIAAGQLIDRFSALALLPWALVPLGAGCVLLGTVAEPWTPFAFMALVGMSNGLSITLFGAVWPEFYGLRHLGSIRALVASAGVFASAAGPGITGYMIDGGISFPAILVAMGVYCFANSVVMLHVARQVAARNRTAVVEVQP